METLNPSTSGKQETPIGSINYKKNIPSKLDVK
jgi:hypothetical protein